MIATQSREKLSYTMAHLYLNKLRAAEAAYRRGHENCDYGLAMFDQEWLQIKQWQNWAAAHAKEDAEIARLCKDFFRDGAELLTVRLHPLERLEWIVAGLEAARQLGDKQAEMVHLYLMGRTQRRLGLFELAMESSKQALSLAKKLRNRLYISKISNVIGAVLYFQNEYEQAQVAYTQALEISKEIGERHETGLAVNGLGTICQMKGDYAASRDYTLEYLAISEANGQPYNVCMALRNLSMINLYLGDEDAAIRYAEQCIPVCEAIGFQTGLIGVLIVLGDLAAAQCRFIQSNDYYQRGLEIARQISHPTNEAFVLCQLGRLYRLMGDFTGSLSYLDEALALSHKIGERWYSANALIEMAAGFRVMGDTRQAGEKLHAGLEIALTIQSSALHTIYLLEGTLLGYAQGEVEQATLRLGLLVENFKLLPAESYPDYHQLSEQLELALGRVEFEAAIEHGKTLDFDTTVRELLTSLRKAFVPR